MEEKVKEKTRDVVRWGFWIILIIVGIWILVGNNSDYLKDKATVIGPPSTERGADTLSDASRNGMNHISDKVYVKYRDTLVDIGHPRFEYLDTSKSSWVRGAWYDDDNQYMIINLSGVNYHYCGMSKSAWDLFKKASSFGSYYNTYIKGRYDCRTYPVPDYKDDVSLEQQPCFYGYVFRHEELKVKFFLA